MSAEADGSRTEAPSLDPDSLDLYLAGWRRGAGTVYRILVGAVAVAALCTAFVEVPVSIPVPEVEILPAEPQGLHAGVSGYVASVRLRSQQQVQRGDTLVVLAAPDLQARQRSLLARQARAAEEIRRIEALLATEREREPSAFRSSARTSAEAGTLDGARLLSLRRGFRDAAEADADLRRSEILARWRREHSAAVEKNLLLEEDLTVTRHALQRLVLVAPTAGRAAVVEGLDPGRYVSAGEEIVQLVPDIHPTVQIAIPRDVYQMLLRGRASSIAVRSARTGETIVHLRASALDPFEKSAEGADRLHIRIPLDRGQARRLPSGRLHADVVIDRVSLASWLLGRHRPG